jgi:ADP-heptose:LPS heptosyltransferase
MRIVECTKDFSRNGTNFKAGKMFVMAEDVEAQFRTVSGDCLGMSHPIEMLYKPYKGEDLTGKRIMCWRTGGIGDMMFLSPVFRHLKKKYPNCFIRVASGCKEPLENLPEIDELYSMPFDSQLLADCDYHLMFQGIIESSNEKSKITHAVDMFYSYFSIDSTHLPAEDKKPRLVFKEDEMKWLATELKSLGITEKDFVLGIQIETSAPLRNYPKENLKTLIDILSKEENVKILLIGSAQQAPLAQFLKGGYPNVIAAVNYDVRKSIILLNRYNVVIAPDSFIIQAAGALDKPLIGLYGPFASEVRMKYFRNAIGMEAKVVCSPCYKHDYRACIKGFPSPCFSLITAEDVLEAVDFLRNKHYGGHFNYMAKLLTDPDFSEIQQYFLSADKGLCFFGGHYKHRNMIHVDTNKFVGADITDLSNAFERSAYPFVLYLNNFAYQGGNLYNNTKGFVRPGGYFISVKTDCNDQFFSEIKRDLGKNFTILYSKLNPDRVGTIVGRKPY